MSEQPYVPVQMPDWRALLDQRSDREKSGNMDVMGYPLSPFLAHFTPAEIRAAKAMSALHGYKWDCVGTDPRVAGRRFLDFARVGLKAALEESYGQIEADKP